MEKRIPVQTGKALWLNVGDHVLFGPDDGTIRTKQLVSKTVDAHFPFGSPKLYLKKFVPLVSATIYHYGPNLILEFDDGTLCDVPSEHEVVRLHPNYRPPFGS